MEIAERHRAWTLSPLNVNGRLQRRHRHAHIRGIRRDAMIARAQNSERTIMTSNSRASAAGLALVARHRGIAEVDTTCALQQVPTNRSHVADLSRSALQDRLRQD